MTRSVRPGSHFEVSVGSISAVVNSPPGISAKLAVTLAQGLGALSRRYDEQQTQPAHSARA